jgi:hypothetical protein
MESNHTGLEDQLFLWDGWDENGPMALQFYKVELKVQVGEFPVGTKFAVACVDGEKSVLTLIEENETEHAYELRLSVGNKLGAL